MVSDINLGKFSILIPSSPSGIPIHVCDTFCSCLLVLGFSAPFSPSLFSFCLSVLKVSMEIFSGSEILSSAVPSLLMSSSKAFFIFVIVVLILALLFLVLRNSSSACIAHLFLVFFLATLWLSGSQFLTRD